MTRLNLILLIAILASPWKASASCVYEGNLRIESAAQLKSLEAKLAGVCEITGNLLIVADDIESFALIGLKKVRLINLHSMSLKAVEFPNLQKADNLYIQSPNLELVNFPQLTQVTATLLLSSHSIHFAHFPKLQSVWKLNIQRNSKLEFVFTDQLNDVYELKMDNNPNLNEASRFAIEGATRVISAEEKRYNQRADAELQKLKQRQLNGEYVRKLVPLPGYKYSHPFEAYYGWYGRFYNNYLNNYYYPAYNRYWRPYYNRYRW